MTLQIPAGPSSRIEQALIAPAVLWRLERVDGVIFYFTDYESPIEFEGNQYSPAYGVEASATQTRQGLQDKNAELTGALVSSQITDEDLQRGLYRGCTIYETVVDSRTPWVGGLFTTVFRLTDIQWNGESWEAQVTGSTTRLRQSKGRIYTRTCRRVLGDEFCQVALEDFTEDATAIGPGNSPAALSITLSTAVPGYYQDGVLTWTSGQNAGVASQVRSYNAAASVLTLQIAPPFDIVAGDTCTVSAGCAHDVVTCDEKFGNVDNFGGFPHIPGSDRALSVPNPNLEEADEVDVPNPRDVARDAAGTDSSGEAETTRVTLRGAT